MGGAALQIHGIFSKIIKILLFDTEDMPKLLTYSKIMKNLTVEKQSKYIKFDELEGDDHLRQKFEERLKLKQADRKYQKAMAAYYARQSNDIYLNSYKIRLKEIVENTKQAECFDEVFLSPKKRSFMDITADNEAIPAYSILV